MKVSVVIPAFNEADNIHNIVTDVTKSLAGLSDEITDHEIIIVDDASTDNTFETIENLSLPSLSAIRLSRRSGSHIAIRAGLDCAQGDAVICIAADGQDDPQSIGKLINTWQAGNEIVWALRRSRKNEGFLAPLFAKAFYQLLSLFGETDKRIDLSRADFYLLDRKVVDAITSCRETNTSLFGLIAWLGFQQGYIEYDRQPRHSGSSKWTFKSKLRLAQDWIIAFSGIPLKLMTLAGFMVATTGFLYAVFVITRGILYGSPLLGWSSVMTAILLLGGGQMIMLGIMGEYLWRTLDESRNRPSYFIEKHISAKQSHLDNG